MGLKAGLGRVLCGFLPGQRAGASVKTAAGTGDGWADVELRESYHVRECYGMMRVSSKPTLVAPVLMEPGPGSRCLGGCPTLGSGGSVVCLNAQPLTSSLSRGTLGLSFLNECVRSSV